MSNNPEQKLCTATVDNPEPREACCHEQADTAQAELGVSSEATIEPTPDQAAGPDPKEQAPEADPPAATDADTAEQSPWSGPQESTETDPVTALKPDQDKVQAAPLPPKSRIPRAIFQYYLQFGFTPQAVAAILHLPPKDLTNNKVSFVPTTPPKNC